MVPDPVPPDLTELLVVVIISAVSGFISIAQRIGAGRKPNTLWVSSEFLASLLCGYLMMDIYPHISAAYLPEWVSLLVAVAMAAHLGGRLLQYLDELFNARYKKLLKSEKKTD